MAAAHPPEFDDLADRPGGDGPALQIALQIVGQVQSGGVALSGVLLQALQTDRIEVAVHLRIELGGRHRFLADDQQDGVERRRGPKRRPARQAFVQDDAQGIDVRGRPNVLLSARLLGCHVAGRAQDGAAGRLPGIAVQLLGQAEIGNLRNNTLQTAIRRQLERPVRRLADRGRGIAQVRVLIAGRQQNVGRLEIAMDDVRLMGDVHGPGQAAHHLGRVAGRQRPTVQLLRQAAPLAIFEGKVGQTVVLADLVDLHDVRMMEPGHGLGLGQKTGAIAFIGVGPGEDHLQSDDAVEARLPRLVDDAHAAASEGGQDVVAGNFRQRALIGRHRAIGNRGRSGKQRGRTLHWRRGDAGRDKGLVLARLSPVSPSRGTVGMGESALRRHPGQLRAPAARHVLADVDRRCCEFIAALWACKRDHRSPQQKGLIERSIFTQIIAGPWKRSTQQRASCGRLPACRW